MKRHYRVIGVLAIIGLVTWLALAGAGVAAAASAVEADRGKSSIVVDVNKGDDEKGEGTALSPYRTINHALAQASGGAVVVVQPGIYKESLSVVRRVTLTSDPERAYAPSRTVIEAAGFDVGIQIKGGGAAGTIIEGLTIQHANNQGIFAEDTSGIIIRGNHVDNNALAPTSDKIETKAILLVGVSSSYVLNNTVTGNKGGGIAVTDNGPINPGALTPGTPGPAMNNVIGGNDVTDNEESCGIVVAAFNPGQGVIGNLVTGNTVSHNPAGIIVAANPPGTSAIDNVVSGNTITDNFLPGVIVHGNAPGQRVQGTVVSGNTIRRNGADPEVGLTDPAGIIVVGAVVKVQDTLISGNRMSDEKYAVWFSGAEGTLVQGNHLDASVGIPLSGQ
jgi:parallel beta-helix repeat protein